MIIVAFAAASAGFYISLKQSQQSQQRSNIEGLFWPNPKQIVEFETIDQAGNIFGIEQLKGKWSFVFFGYTHCPDICPITMSVMAEAYKKISMTNNDTQIIFVTVDPMRDTTEILAQYVAYFNEKFIGLGGSLEQISSLTKQIGIAFYYDKTEETDNYLVDHSASIFLFDPKARMVGKISPPHQAEQITQQFNRIKEFIDAQH